MYTQKQLEAIEVTAKMIGGVLMGLEDPTVAGEPCDLLDQVFNRLKDIQALCSEVITAAEEGTV